MDEHDPPHVVEASTPPHESTIIFLHGRGDFGSSVARSLIGRPINSEHSEASRQNSNITFHHLLPRTKFVFPTSLRRQIERFRGEAMLIQWFDIDSLSITDYCDDGQIEGIKESTDYIHQLIQAEVDAGIPPEKIVVMGISQGCATGAIAVMRYPGKLGGFVGISGWLPFITRIQEMLEKDGDFVTVLEYIENRLESGKEVTRENAREVLKTPVFLGHGIGDTKIVPLSGERLRNALKGMKFQEVVWATYRVGHWWCNEELIHIAAWLGLKGFSVNGLGDFTDGVGSLSTEGVLYSTD
ncbi:hypothetical protein TWF718_001207 [Orbilia javanica]|uniref:Acyl-protein thioesterase 1 n=1 Tax=Orbilia javanica TaxID=47235 RepID=A0AAN8N8F9_9PEZI